MVWRASGIKDEKIKFIGDWLKQESSHKDLCERYGISRKTGYKLIKRYVDEGEKGLDERSRARHEHPNQLSAERQIQILEIKSRYPTWGPRKIRDWLLLNETESEIAASSTIGELLKRHGLVKSRRYNRRAPAYGLPFKDCINSNDIWSADFKGQFRLGNTRYCYPLTISDNHSRYLLKCEGLSHPSLECTQKGFEKVFIEYGLPLAIRTDNGQPFAGVGIGGLTRLSIWWLKLGILPERIESGRPDQNGRHERMHRTLKESTANPSQADERLQQICFDRFRKEYNEERPHEALGGKRPGDIYKSSPRIYSKKYPEIIYPDQLEIRKVRSNGEVKWGGKKYYISELLSGEPIGLERVDEERAFIYFAQLKIGLLDVRKDKIIRS